MPEVLDYCRKQLEKAEKVLRAAHKEYKSWKNCVDYLELRENKKAEAAERRKTDEEQI